MSDAEKIVAALSMDNMVDAKEAFEAALAEKITDKFEAKKVEIAAQMTEAKMEDFYEDRSYIKPFKDKQTGKKLFQVSNKEGTLRIIDNEREAKKFSRSGDAKLASQDRRIFGDESVSEGKEEQSLDEAKMDDSEVLSAAKRLAKNGKDEKTKKFGQGLVDFYEKNKSFTPDQVSGLQNIMKNASFQMAKDD